MSSLIATFIFGEELEELLLVFTSPLTAYRKGSGVNITMSFINCLLRAANEQLLPGVRLISSCSPAYKWKFVEKVTNDTTYVSMEEVVEPPAPISYCALCTCNIPVKLSYSDVLILEQFMREDGTVLPREITGLCKNQQLRLERCVMQAHWAGLFPDKTIPEFDRSGYKRFNRYWNDDMDMYRLKEKIECGTWYYIKRYPTGNQKIIHRKKI
ncbi:putative ribosomal protein S18 [Dictyocaulus viviparus]|uniref:Putative ribosomal protein S18 n=1 Tax=Dictyocaulus viviparus TaxID=29172 RepID=A0A0D8YD61_DICVI|nr:putative ribosomal protein S18 [Dictyocaulus viviparus]